MKVWIIVAIALAALGAFILWSRRSAAAANLGQYGTPIPGTSPKIIGGAGVQSSGSLPPATLPVALDKSANASVGGGTSKTASYLAMGGGVAGAAIGTAIGGPVGTAIGATLGSFAGRNLPTVGTGIVKGATFVGSEVKSVGGTIVKAPVKAVSSVASGVKSVASKLKFW
jgi:hypothetical protein